MKGFNRDHDTVKESEKHWPTLQLASTRISPRNDEGIIPIKEVVEHDIEVMNVISSMSLYDLRARFLSGMIANSMGKDIVITAKNRKYLKEPAKSNMGQRVDHLKLTQPLSAWDEPTEAEIRQICRPMEDSITTSFENKELLNVVVELANELGGTDTERVVKFQNFENETQQPNVKCTSTTTVLDKKEILYLLDMKYQNLHVQTAPKRERMALLENLIKYQAEGKIKFRADQKWQCEVSDLGTGWCDVVITNKSHEMMWADTVGESDNFHMTGIWPETSRTFKLKQDFVRGGGCMYLWYQVVTDHIVNIKKINLYERLPGKKRKLSPMKGKEVIVTIESSGEEEMVIDHDNIIMGPSEAKCRRKEDDRVNRSKGK